MRLIIFDLDGTLIDSVRLIVDTISAAFVDLGEPVPTERAIRAVSGLTALDALARLAPNADEARREALFERYLTHYNGATDDRREVMFPGGREVLDRLRMNRNNLLAVATGKGYRGARELLNRNGIDHYFHSLQTPDHNRGKPDPQMVLSAIESAGGHPRRTAVIGDTVHDMRMAKTAGVAAIGVTWGYHEARTLREAGADQLVEDFSAIDPALDRLLGPADA